MNWFKRKYTQEQLRVINEEFVKDPISVTMYLKGTSNHERLKMSGVPNSGNRNLIRKLNQRRDEL